MQNKNYEKLIYLSRSKYNLNTLKFLIANEQNVHKKHKYFDVVCKSNILLGYEILNSFFVDDYQLEDIYNREIYEQFLFFALFKCNKKQIYNLYFALILNGEIKKAKVVLKYLIEISNFGNAFTFSITQEYSDYYSLVDNIYLLIECDLKKDIDYYFLLKKEISKNDVMIISQLIKERIKNKNDIDSWDIKLIRKFKLYEYVIDEINKYNHAEYDGLSYGIFKTTTCISFCMVNGLDYLLNRNFAPAITERQTPTIRHQYYSFLENIKNDKNHVAINQTLADLIDRTIAFNKSKEESYISIFMNFIKNASKNNLINAKISENDEKLISIEKMNSSIASDDFLVTMECYELYKDIIEHNYQNYPEKKYINRNISKLKQLIRKYYLNE